MENKHAVYLNMCHHYRKIFNAKSCVDTSPPKAYTKQANRGKRQGSSPLRIRSTIVKNCTPVRTSETISKKNDSPVICPYFYQHHLKDMERTYVDNKSFMVPKKPFSPVILKTDAQSKLRNLHIYHPPRKKRTSVNNSKSTKSTQSTNTNDRVEEKLHSRNSFPKSDQKTTKLTSISALENSSSEESSEDSAYNEGECILSSDSRGSTPQISTVKNQLTKRSLGTSTCNDKIIRKISLSHNENEKDDIVCIQFLKEITSDILKKNIFTNKALRTVFQYHMTLNKYQLGADRMQREVTKLQERLGVPLDDQFDDEDFGLGKDFPNIEIRNEKEAIIEESISCIESLSTTDQLANNTKNEKNTGGDEEGQHRTEDYEENYSDDSFSDLSHSDEEKSENDEINSGTQKQISDNERNKESNGSSSSDNGKNYCKSATNSDIDSDLEISEAC